MDEAMLNAMAVWTSIDSRLGGLALSHLATKEKIVEIASTEWLDESLDRYANKTRMKEVGGAAFQYNLHLHETSILSLAKAIDDTSRDLKQIFKFRFDSFDENHGVSNVQLLQQVRSLANVIKHNGSHLQKGTSTSATFLVDTCGMTDGWGLETLILVGDPAFDIVEHVPKIYRSMLELVEKASSYKHPAMKLNEIDFFNWVYSTLLPDVLTIDRPSKGTPAGEGATS